MKLTTKGRYAIIAMIDIALRSNNTPVSLSEIAKRQSISLSYLEQLFSKLKSGSLVKSTRGPGGGYVLDRDPSEITFFEIITSVDEAVRISIKGDIPHHKKIQRVRTFDLFFNQSIFLFY